MQINTADFAYWTIEEYERPDGTKPEQNVDTAENVRVFCAIADLFVKKIGSGEVETRIDPETEHLVIEFHSENIGHGRLEVENIFKPEGS